MLMPLNPQFIFKIKMVILYKKEKYRPQEVSGKELFVGKCVVGIQEQVCLCRGRKLVKGGAFGYIFN